eukprot:4671303-Pyramimonas_sp.AAC.1
MVVGARPIPSQPRVACGGKPVLPNFATCGLSLATCASIRLLPLPAENLFSQCRPNDDATNRQPPDL